MKGEMQGFCGGSSLVQKHVGQRNRQWGLVHSLPEE